jgi:hypothetical protein
MLSKEEREELIHRYEAGPQLILDAYESMPDDARRWRPAERKWSAHEVICHCADSEANAALRIRYLFAEKEPRILGYDEHHWSEVLDYQNHPIDPAFDLIFAARANTIPLLRAASDDLWARVGVHSERGPWSAEAWLQVYAEHLEVHARQIERNLAAWRGR